MKNFTITLESLINYTCLSISAIAPALAIGIEIGLPTGIAIALGLAAVINAQKHASRAVRSKYMVGAIIIRCFSAAMEQMAYSDRLARRSTLPFDISPTMWAWIAVFFMAALDIWALSAVAAKSQATVEEEDINASILRAQAQDAARHAREILEANAKREHELAIINAQSSAAAETAKIQAETERKRMEVDAEAERNRAEAERKQAERQEEKKRKEAEEARKEEEVRRKEQEEKRQQAEIKRKQEEAKKEAILAQKEEKEAEEREALRLQAQVEKEEAEARAEALRKKNSWKSRWAEASTEGKKLVLLEAEAHLTVGGKLPTKLELASLLGTSDRTIRSYTSKSASHV